MESEETAVCTRDLTESFGWTEAHSFQQHDLQELLRVLTDHLEEKMKHTAMERSISHLLQVCFERPVGMNVLARPGNIDVCVLCGRVYVGQNDHDDEVRQRAFSVIAPGGLLRHTVDGEGLPFS